MSSNPNLPAGIRRNANGTYRVQVPIAVGSKQMATRTLSTLYEALIAWAFADEAKNAGADVHAALYRNVALTGVAPIHSPRKRARPIPTFGELLDDLLMERRRLAEVSDHSRRRSLSKGRNSFRPTSLKNLEKIARRLRPEFGHVPVDELTRDVINDWLMRLAEGEPRTRKTWNGEAFVLEDLERKGLSQGYAKTLLVWVRAVVARAFTSERPEDFPWAGLCAITPANPLKPASLPNLWGGKVGDRNPVLTAPNMVALANAMKAPDRIVIYSEYLGGPRIGEIFGLRLQDLEFDSAGVLRAEIARQMTFDDLIVEWVKTDASYRNIPIPAILAEYIVEYCAFYHRYDLRNPDPERAHRTVVVNPSGRALDGTYLPGLRSGWSSRLIAARKAAGLGHSVLGYSVDSHHLRKSAATTLLLALQIVAAIDSAHAVAVPIPMDLIAQVEHYKARAARVEEFQLGYSKMDVSAYLGHEFEDSKEDLPASAVTIDYYLLSVNSTAPFDAIAKIMDYITRDQITALHHIPDHEDLLPVHALNDPDWMTVHEAVELTGLHRSNVSANVKAGRFDGHLAWIANGGYLRNAERDSKAPALPQYAVSRRSVQDHVDRANRLAAKTAASLLGITDRTFMVNFVQTGMLTAVGDRFERTDVNALIVTIHDAVIEATRKPRMTNKRLKPILSSAIGDLFVEDRVLQSWVDAWIEQLVGNGRLRTRNDGSLAPSSEQPVLPPRNGACRAFHAVQ